MDFSQDVVLSSLRVFDVTPQRRGRLFVPGRDFHSFTWRCCGKISLETEGNVQISESGCLTYVPRGMPYYTEVLENGYMIAVHFQTVGGGLAAVPIIEKPSQRGLFQSLFSALLGQYTVGRETDYVCMALMYQILAALQNEWMTGKRSAIPTCIREAKEYIDKNFGDAMLSVSALAREMGVSDVYFRRRFKECFSVSPMAYIKQVRLDNARALLQTGYYPVSTVALRCGFDSVSYFSYEFHRLTGMTPSEYAGRKNG